MRNSATVRIQSKPAALKERVRLTSIPLLLALLLVLIVSRGVPLSSSELAQHTHIGWILFTCAAAFASIAWTFCQWRGRQMMARLDLQFEERLSERACIGRDLQDTMLQVLLNAQLHLCAADDQSPEDSGAKRLVSRALDLMARAIDGGRHALRGLRSSHGSSQDLEQAFLRIHEELTSHRDVSQIAFGFIVGGASLPLNPATRDEVYLIGREALINAVRHSSAGKIEVELEYGAKSLRVLVRDNGCGIDPRVLHSGRTGHCGLSGMLERAERIEAKLRVLSRVGAGTEIELSVPGRIAFDLQSGQPQSMALPTKGLLGQSPCHDLANNEPKEKGGK